MKRLGYAVVALSLGLVPAYGFVFEGWFLTKVQLDDHVAKISPHLEVTMPDKNGPSAGAPVAIIMPGCLGTRTFHRTWALHLAQAGWASVIVDSFTPRDRNSIADLEPVCEGARPWGFERAADLIAALQFVRANPEFNSESTVLVGWSHGGWATMDAMTFGRSPRSHSVQDLPTDWFKGIVGVALFYPYCGFGARTGWHGWTADVPVRMYFGDADDNVPIKPCQRAIEDLSRSGHDAVLTVFEDQGHWFDNPADYNILDHKYDAETAEFTRQDVLAWFGDLVRLQKP